MKKRARADSTSSGADEGWAVMTTLIGGFAVWGGIGWLLDRWWGTTFLTPVGVIVGMALGVFAVVARHGGLKTTGVRSIPDPQPGPPPASTRRETECP